MTTMTTTSTLRFQLNISAEQYEAYYRGSVQFVRTNTLDGRTIRFPANILRPYLSHTGIQGLFEISFDAENRFSALKRISI